MMAPPPVSVKQRARHTGRATGTLRSNRDLVALESWDVWTAAVAVFRATAARVRRDAMSTTNSADWQNAIETAHTLADEGATFHRTTRSDLWWVDPVPRDPPTARPASYWVTLHPDGRYSWVCDTFLDRKSPKSPCSHIARVCP